MRGFPDIAAAARPNPAAWLLPRLLVAGGLIATYASTFAWMSARWSAQGSSYGHGPLIPVISLVWCWLQRDRLATAKSSPSGAGMGLVLGGLTLHAVSLLASVHFTSALSMLLVAAGLVLYLQGREVLRVVLHPLIFLVFAVPIPLMAVAHLTLELKLFAASAGVAVTSAFGIPIVQDGSVLHVGSERLVVGDACSGLRSLIALLALGYLFVQQIPGGILARLSAYALVLPLAVVGNVARVVALCCLAYALGAENIGGGIHDFTGLLIYAITISGLFAVVRLAQRRQERREGQEGEA